MPHFPELLPPGNPDSGIWKRVSDEECDMREGIFPVVFFRDDLRSENYISVRDYIRTLSL
jgi:hypothetical protein